ncbi:MAG: hypothetical protein MUF03_06780 [Rubrivivax sp.]|nr:hypothetical protein [Rubrivivax sp.]
MTVRSVPLNDTPAVNAKGAAPAGSSTANVVPSITTESGVLTPPAPSESSKWKVTLVMSTGVDQRKVMVGSSVQPT